MTSSPSQRLPSIDNFKKFGSTEELRDPIKWLDSFEQSAMTHGLPFDKWVHYR